MHKKFSDYSLLFLRIVIGAVFVYHGWPKLFSQPELLGLPGFVGFLVGIVEVVFGVLILLGVGFPWVTYPLGVVILVALFFMQLPKGITAGSERDLIIAAVLFLLGAIGPGKYSMQKNS